MSPNTFHIIITMGNTPHQTSSQQPINIANAYLSKVLKGVKQEVDSTVEIQIITNQQIYLKWNKDAQSYKQEVSKALQLSSQTIHYYLLFPIASSYQANRSICGDKEGKVLLSFGNGLLSLQQSKMLHIQENMPFTAFQIWNLLFTMLEFNTIIKKASLGLDLRPQSIYVDLRTKIIKLRNPYSFLGSQSQRYTHERYVDTQKLQLMVRKIKVPQQIEKQNDDFNIGMMAAEVMLLQTSCMIYDDGLTSHKTINPTLHYLLIQKILTVSYYPLKLRIIIAGLIQFNARDRFASDEVSNLLQQEKIKIKAFTNFHLRKTAFQNIFKQKLKNIEAQMSKLKQKTNASLYKERIPMASHYNKEKELLPTKLVPSFKRNIQEVENPPEQSINLSIINLQQHNRHPQLQSLMLSKSQIKSSMQQKSSVKDPSFNLTNSIQMKPSPRGTSPFSLPQPHKIHKTTSNPFDQIQKHIKQQQQSLPCKEVTNTPNSNQKETVRQQASQNKSNSLKASQEKQQQVLRELLQAKGSELKESHIQVKGLFLQNRLEFAQSQKKIQHKKAMEEADISQISRKDRSHEDRASRNSSVVEYVSELYEAERVIQTPSEVTHTQNTAQRLREEQSEQKKYFESSEHQGLAIRKVDSYEMPPDSRSSGPDPFSSVVISHQMKISHKDSLIDGLTPLVNSKKLIQEPYKPQKLSESAQKRVQYWKTFSKFSPQVIAQLKLPARYPDSQNLKRSMRETISLSSMLINKTKRMFPQQWTAKQEVSYPSVQQQQNLH